MNRAGQIVHNPARLRLHKCNPPRVFWFRKPAPQAIWKCSKCDNLWLWSDSSPDGKIAMMYGGCVWWNVGYHKALEEYNNKGLYLQKSAPRPEPEDYGGSGPMVTGFLGFI